MFDNDVFNDILNEFECKKNSHSYIFYTNEFLSCINDLKKLVKKIFNVNNLNLIVSDYYVVKKSEKKNILKEEIESLKDFFQNTTYINKYRIYLIEEAHKLNSSSANIILKFLEEPAAGVTAFFVTTNLDAVLPTIKSRCQIVNTFYDSSFVCDDDTTILDKLFDDNKYVSLFRSKKVLEKYDRNELINMFNSYLLKCYNDVNEKNILLIKKINNVISMLNSNVNVDYVMDTLCLESSEE